MKLRNFGVLTIVALTLGAVGLSAQQAARVSSTDPRGSAGAVLPPGYVIGPSDALTVVFLRDKEMSGDVIVRPDGKISLPILNEISAAGLSPEELRLKLATAAAKYVEVEDPEVTVIVREIRSRIVFITGNVAKPANYPLNSEMTVLQLIAVAGGLLEYADSKNIMVVRTENGRQQYHKFNYKDVVKQKATAQNIALKPGDTVVVP
jgi:polysaccharide export outer membrane protein